MSAPGPRKFRAPPPLPVPAAVPVGRLFVPDFPRAGLQAALQKCSHFPGVLYDMQCRSWLSCSQTEHLNQGSYLSFSCDELSRPSSPSRPLPSRALASITSQRGCRATDPLAAKPAIYPRPPWISARGALRSQAATHRSSLPHGSGEREPRRRPPKLGVGMGVTDAAHWRGGQVKL